MKWLLLLLALCATAWGAPAIVQHKTGNSQASQVTVAVTVTSTTTGNTIFVGTGNSGTRTVTGVTDNIGNTYRQATNAAANAGTFETDVWYSPRATGGVTTITITFSGAAGTFNKDGFAWEVSGFSGPVPDVAAPLNNGVGVSGNYTGASVTTTSPVGFVVGVWVGAASINQNPQTGNEFTSGGDVNPTSGNAACSLLSGTAAAHNPAWHGGVPTASFAASTAAFKEASGGHRPLSF